MKSQLSNFSILILKHNFILFCLLFSNYICTQNYTEFYRDVFYGGVTGSGYSPSYNDQNYNGIFTIENIPLNSSIKKAFLLIGQIGEIETDFQLKFNGIIYNLSENTATNESFMSFVYGGQSRIHFIEVTNVINVSQNVYTIENISLLNPSSNRYSDYYLIVLYENNNLNKINLSILFNNNDFTDAIEYNFTELNPINNLHDVGLSLFSGYICDSLNDGEIIYVNNIYSGKFGGNNTNSGICGGPTGDFDFRNNTFTGINNDFSNQHFFGQDLIINIKNLVLNNDTEIKLNYNSVQTGNLSNSIWSNFLTYSTPCQPFNVTVPPDTTICANSPLQLLATGGTSTGTLPAYEWKPATGLSCTDCPNPVFTSDSSMFCTVRIRSNDSCSVVRPLKINVRPQPVFSEILTTKSECFGTSGSITATSQAQGASYSLDGGALQSSGFFENLAAGDYTLTLHDVNGCTKDTLITIEDTLTVSAQFAVTPSSGAAPLTVQITNQSQNATDYEWFLNGASTGSATVQNYTFDTSGVYEIMLFAWQNNPSCIDSFSLTIQVYDSLMVEIPNVFTPNNDGINEAFGVTINIPAEVKYRIFNRWGNEMKAGSVWTTPGVFVEIWNGALAGSIEASEGVYFYQLEVRDLSMSSPSVPLPKGEDEIYVIFNGFFELRK